MSTPARIVAARSTSGITRALRQTGSTDRRERERRLGPVPVSALALDRAGDPPAAPRGEPKTSAMPASTASVVEIRTPRIHHGEHHVEARRCLISPRFEARRRRGKDRGHRQLSPLELVER